MLDPSHSIMSETLASPRHVQLVGCNLHWTSPTASSCRRHTFLLCIMTSVSEAKTLICEMCRNFYAKGWASGTGGGMSIKVNRCSSA